MGKIPDEDTSVRIKRRTSSHLAILVRTLNFHSADEFIDLIVDIVFKKQWTKEDLESIHRYGKIIQEMEGTAKSDEEMLSQLGIKKLEKIEKELDFIEKGLDVKGKVKKPEKPFSFKNKGNWIKKPKVEKDERKGVND